LKETEGKTRTVKCDERTEKGKVSSVQGDEEGEHSTPSENFAGGGGNANIVDGEKKSFEKTF